MLKIRLLGQFDLRIDQKRITIPSRVGQSLFAYLALTAGTAHRREKLAGTFWPETTDENSRKYLRQELWRIRKVITSNRITEKEYLLADEFSLTFNNRAAYWLDAALIEHSDADLQSLITNLSLYQGELLPGFYDDWVILERERLQTIFDARMDLLLEQLVASKRWIAVQDWGERWLSLSGVREPAYRALMLVSGVRGDMARVGALYQRCTEELMKNLGVEPSAETNALYEGLLKGAKVSKRAAKFLSSGTVTFLFMDIEASTRLLGRLGKEYQKLLIEYHNIILAAIEKWNGKELERQGDSFFVTFPRALDAVQCAAALQRIFTEHTWVGEEPVRVRMGLHSAESLINSSAYVGMDVHRAARIGDAGHGGQILLSQTTRELVTDSLPPDVSIRDLGDQSLKDLRSPTVIYQLIVEGLQSEFLPLRRKFTGQEDPISGDPPFKGLQYFDEEDADLFFGREKITAKLADHLCNGHCLSVVIGASGSGKSSIVRAGLVPTLKRGEVLSKAPKKLGEPGEWQVHVITPTDKPIWTLAAKLTDEVESVSATATLIDDLLQDPRSLSLFLSRLNQNKTTVLVIDQFEELFTLCRDAFEREAYIDNLLTALDSLDGKFILIITLRADFYAHLSQYPELRDLAAKRQEYIGPMTTEDLRRAIEEPAKQGLWEFETGLVDLILRDIGEEPGALPLLSHALLETWKRRAGHMLTLRGYEDAGGVRGAIAQTAENTYISFPEPDQTIVRNIFLRLTEFGEGTEDTRRRASLEELVSHETDVDRTKEILNQLAEARLVTMREDSVEVAHEALIREWPQLREWLEQDREGIVLHRHLTDATREWALLERDPGALYRGARLAQANEWVTLNPQALNEHEKQFLDASNRQVVQEQKEREEARERELAAAKELAETQRNSAARLRTRNRFITAIGMVAVVLAMLALLFSSRANQNAQEAQVNLQQALTAEALAVDEQLRANDERDRADEERDNALAAQGLAQSRELAMAALSEMDVDPERSALLAIQSLSTAFSIEAQEALHQAVQYMRITQRFEGHEDSLYSIAYNMDGSRLATASGDGTARIWDTATGEMLFSISSGNSGIEFNIVRYHPDGQAIATGDSAGSVKLWDAETGEERQTFSLSMVRGEEGQMVEGSGDDIQVSAIAFSPDGTQLIGGNIGGTIMIWDLNSGAEAILPEKPQLTGLAFHPDGVHLAVSNGAYPGFVSMLEIPGGEQLYEIEAGNLVSNLAFSPEGNTLVTTDIDGNLIVWDPLSGEILASKMINGELYSPAFSPDGGLLVFAHPNGTAIVLDAKTLEELFVLRGHTASVNSVAFSPDGEHVATASTDGTALEWSLNPGHELMTISTNDYLLRVAYHPSGEQLATTSYTGNVSVWDTNNGNLIWQQHGHDEFVGGLAYSSDGSLLATSSDVPPVIIVWDAATGEQLLTIEGHTNYINNIAFSPDGQFIASASEDNTVRVWDLQGQEVMSIEHPSAVRGIAFHPAGEFLSTSPWENIPEDRDADGEEGSDQRIVSWDLDTGEQVLNLGPHSDWVRDVVYNPDGDWLAAAAQDGWVTIWDNAAGKQLLSFEAFNHAVFRLAFSPESDQIATSGGVSLKIWDAVTGNRLITFEDHQAEIYDIAYSPDGRYLASASLDGTVRIRILELDELIATAQNRLTRTWTEEECKRFLHLEACPPLEQDN